MELQYIFYGALTDGMAARRTARRCSVRPRSAKIPCIQCLAALGAEVAEQCIRIGQFDLRSSYGPFPPSALPKRRPPVSLDLPGAGQIAVAGDFAYVGHIPNKLRLGSSGAPSSHYVSGLRSVRGRPMELTLLSKSSCDKLKNPLFRHLGRDVKIVRIGKTSQLVRIELIKFGMDF